VRRQTGLKSMAVGLITHPEQAEAILAQGDADLIAIAREALVDPAWGCMPQPILAVIHSLKPGQSNMDGG